MDQQIGHLLAHLKEVGLYDDALLVVTSDHGEEFQDHGGWTHGSTLYNELIRVPLIVKYPSTTAETSGRIDTPVSLVDLLPTAEDLLNARWPSDAFVGRSLLSTPHNTQARPLYAETSDKTSLRVAIHDRRKLIQKIDSDGHVIKEQVFDLDQDLREKQSLRPEEAFSESDLSSLRAWLAQSHASSPGSTAQLDEATLDELRSLGYVN